MSDEAPPPVRQDTRRTSAEKLTRMQEIAIEMLREAARDPDDKTMGRLAIWGERINKVIEGSF